MKIAGLQPVTLLDYPQKLAAIIFTSGCNMRCPFCYNPFLVLPEWMKKNKLMAEKDLFVFFKKRKKYLDGVVISGGEPTLQRDLPKFCHRLKKLGYAVKLDTNGLMPEVLRQLIAEKLVDYIAMDLKSPLEKTGVACGLAVDAEKIKASIELIKNSGVDYEFRTTLVKGLHEKADIKKMAELIKGAKKYYLQNFSRVEQMVGGKFKGRSFARREMAEFAKLAKKLVAVCAVR